MAEDKNVQPAKQDTKPVELTPRIHINEFLGAHAHDLLNSMQVAGFKAVVKKEWMRLEEWKEQLSKYLGN